MVVSDAIVVVCACGKKIHASSDRIGFRTICPRCGRALTITDGDQAQVLPQVVETEAFDPNEHVLCPKCKTRLNHGARLCTNCGLALESGEKIKTRFERLRGTGRRGTYITICGVSFSPVALVALVTAAGYGLIALYMSMVQPAQQRQSAEYAQQVFEVRIARAVEYGLKMRGLAAAGVEEVEVLNEPGMGEMPRTLSFAAKLRPREGASEAFEAVGRVTGEYDTRDHTIRAYAKLLSGRGIEIRVACLDLDRNAHAVLTTGADAPSPARRDEPGVR